MGRLVRRACGLGVALIALAGASCGDDEESVGANVVVADGMAVSDAWARPTPPSAEEAAIYVEIRNVDAPDDQLLGGRSDRCLTVHAHATSIDDGIASMNVADPDDLQLPPGGRLDLVPTGLHLMCVGLGSPLVEGDELMLELVFERHPTIAVLVAVEDR